jgi:type IV pilus assembly protein PilQ
LDIEDETVQDIFNYILRLTRLEANLEGRTVFVGSRLPDVARNIITRTLRLNQASAAEAAAFLSAQGAETQRVVTRTRITIEGEGIDRQRIEETTTEITPLGAQVGTGPLLQRGLSVLSDERLNAVTIVGEPSKVEIATQFLAKLDARQRQVAVNVKIIDVNLANVDNFSTSFSFGINDSFFVNDAGAAAVNFGGVNPPSRNAMTASPLVPPVIANPAAADVQFDRNQLIQVPLTGPRGSEALFLRPIPGISSDPLRVNVSEYEVFEVDPTTGVITAGEATFSLPTLFQYPQRFLSLLQAQIQSRNAKILTDPTLVVQEGESAQVNLTQDVLQSVTVTTQDTVAGPRDIRTPTLAAVGLTLAISIDNIDDNGFITMQLNPEVSSPVGQESTGAAGGFVTLVQRRSLNSGRLRLRDGQTLIVSGIIQDQDRTTVSKIPILGDLPLIGSLFRSTTRQNERAEVIVLVTPQILDDSENAGFGYGYAPGQEAQQMLNRNR